jgi:protein-disulfide isomerase
MFKLMTTAALGLALLAGSAAAQTSATDWDEVRAYLERNPKTLQQLENLMAREIGPEQVAEDAAYIAENIDMIFYDPATPVLGNPDGEILIAKFSDYRCIHCLNVTPELQKLIDSDPRVRLVIREFPILGQDSTESAKFALAVKQVGGDEAFAKVEEILFESDARITGYLLEDIAAEIGLDPRTVIEAMSAPEVQKQLEDTFGLAQALKIQGTPGLIIKDTVIRGGIPFEAMQKAIAELYAE